MVPLIVFYLHVIAVAAGFTRRYQEEGAGEGALAVFFIALIFFVGWGMASFIMKLFMPPEGFGPAFDRDAAALVLLTLVESVFYYFYFKTDTPHGTEEQMPTPAGDSPAGSKQP